MTYRKYIRDNNKAFRRCVNILEYLRLKKVIVKSRRKHTYLNVSYANNFFSYSKHFNSELCFDICF